MYPYLSIYLSVLQYNYLSIYPSLSIYLSSIIIYLSFSPTPVVFTFILETKLVIQTSLLKNLFQLYSHLYIQSYYWPMPYKIVNYLYIFIKHTFRSCKDHHLILKFMIVRLISLSKLKQIK